MKLAVELNSFLNAWNATNKNLGASDDQEYKRLRTRVLQQKLETDPKITDAKLKYYGLKQDNISAATDLVRGRLKKLNTPTPTDAAPANLTPSYSYPNSDVPVESDATGKQSGDNYVPGEMSALGEDDEDDLPMFSARGGPVKKMAVGGAVDDNDEDDIGQSTTAGQMAVSDDDEDDMGQGMEGAPETGDEMGTQVADASGSPSYSMQAAHDAVRDGLQYQVAQLQQRTGAVDTGAHHRTRRSAANDAIDPRQMEAVFKAVDPEGKMSVGERGMAAFGHVYSYLLGKGDILGAQKAASGMLQYYNIKSHKWRAMARAAAENGDLNGTVKALVKSYENIPDGMDINVIKQGEKLGFEFKDGKTGKTMRRIIASPDEILNAATHGTLPSFEDLIVQSAGRRYQASKGGGDGKAKAPGVGRQSDRLKAYEVAGEEAGSFDEKYVGDARNIMSDLIGSGMNPGEASGFVQALIAKKLPQGFKIDRDNNLHLGGQTYQLSDNAVAKLAVLMNKVKASDNEALKAGLERKAGDMRSKMKTDAEHEKENKRRRAMGAMPLVPFVEPEPAVQEDD